MNQKAYYEGKSFGEKSVGNRKYGLVYTHSSQKPASHNAKQLYCVHDSYLLKTFKNRSLKKLYPILSNIQENSNIILF